MASDREEGWLWDENDETQALAFDDDVVGEVLRQLAAADDSHEQYLNAMREEYDDMFRMPEQNVPRLRPSANTPEQRSNPTVTNAPSRPVAPAAAATNTASLPVAPPANSSFAPITALPDMASASLGAQSAAVAPAVPNQTFARQACQACRARHERCDRRQPICGDCVLSSTVCTYGGSVGQARSMKYPDDFLP